MINKFEIALSQREHNWTLRKDTEYCVSGSGVFTVEVFHQGNPIYAAILREDYIKLPPFKEDCQIKLIGRNTMQFTIFISDDKLS